MSDFYSTVESQLQDTERRKLNAVIHGLPESLRLILRQTLTQVAPHTLSTWLSSGALQEWIRQGLRILRQPDGPTPAFVSALLAATPTNLAVLNTNELEEWGSLIIDLVAVDGPDAVTILPNGLAQLTDAERLTCYRICKAAAYRSPTTAVALYRALPTNLNRLTEELRSSLLRCLQTAAAFDPAPLPALLPLLAPILHILPPHSRSAVLEHIAHIARVLPAAVARLFRALPRAYEEVGAEGIRGWMLAGEEIARRNPQAGEAFFALESRTSQLVLRDASPTVTLSDVHGVLQKYIHMLCGVALSLEESEHLYFPALLAEGPAEAVVLPASIDIFSTYEENLRLYRVLAAHQAGRVEFGTYQFSAHVLWPALPDFVRQLVTPEEELPDDLTTFFRLFRRPDQLEALFLFLEGKRIAARLANAYTGLGKDLMWAEDLADLRPPALASLLRRLPTPLDFTVDETTTVEDTLLCAIRLLTPQMQAVSPTAETAQSQPSDEVPDTEETEGGTEPAMFEVERTNCAGSSLSSDEIEEFRKRLAVLRAQHQSSGRRKSRQRTQTAILDMRAGSTESETAEEHEEETQSGDARRRYAPSGPRYFYDEWDYLIEDYRSHWCQLREFPLHGDAGAFFQRTLASYADLIPDIKQQFQRLRPRMYRRVKGLPDGEEIDLDAAVSARVDIRTGVSPPDKLYAARQAMERDVAALFLLDLSASTDMQLTDNSGVRIIDMLKEAIVVLSSALEAIGDVYAIYGFSSRGRRNVEMYPVKTFTDSLSTEVKGRISALTPRHSTRMGTAVRHASRKLKDVASRAKLLILLSDGLPEDSDYGPDKHTPTYGLRDTMMALREAERYGILPFCLTVDKGGHDYLRELCAPSRYMVIEDVTTLPLELPKIYQQHIRAREV